MALNEDVRRRGTEAIERIRSEDPEAFNSIIKRTKMFVDMSPEERVEIATQSIERCINTLMQKNPNMSEEVGTSLAFAITGRFLLADDKVTAAEARFITQVFNMPENLAKPEIIMSFMVKPYLDDEEYFNGAIQFLAQFAFGALMDYAAAILSSDGEIGQDELITLFSMYQS